MPNDFIEKLNSLKARASSVQSQLIAAKTQEEIATKRYEELMAQVKELGCDSIEALEVLIDEKTAALTAALEAAELILQGVP